jgi:drug/metabolite transporter superfamily protein YnfA
MSSLLIGNTPELLGIYGPCLYGIIPTLQPAHFGRMYIAYGGIFNFLNFADATEKTCWEANIASDSHHVYHTSE